MKALTFALPTALLCLTPSPATAEIFVGPGDDLQALINAAPDGEVLTLQSDGPFTGGFNWSDKFLTLRAAPGFTPELVGDPFGPALFVNSGSGSTRAVLQGLRLTPGPGSAPGQAFSTVGLGGGASVSCELENCVAAGDILTGGFGPAGVELYLSQTIVQGLVSVDPSGSPGMVVELTDGCEVEQVSIIASSNASISALVSDSSIYGQLSAVSGQTGALELTVRRTSIAGPVDVRQVGATSFLDALLESCSLQGTNGVIGLFSEQADLRCVNLTVTGYDIGLLTDANAVSENLAVFGNGIDVHPSVPAGSVRNSLIESGTFAGQDGNFAGSPLVTEDLELLAGSVGIDAGNSAAAGLGNLDLAGDARVQDGDGDGNAQVNVGARETVLDCIDASHAPIHGSGINPAILTVTQEAVLGGTFAATVAPSPTTLVTVLTVGPPALPPLTLPGIVGEVLVLPGQNLPLSVSVSQHLIPVPDLPDLCGKSIAVQAFRIELSGAIPIAFAGDGALLTLGGQ